MTAFYAATRKPTLVEPSCAAKLEAAEQLVRELEQKLEYVRRAAMNCNIGTHDGTPGPYGTIEAILSILADE